jgi:hypothetical protein
MIKKLENPKTENYLEIKELVLSSFFPWFYQTHTVDYDNIPYYSHRVLTCYENSVNKVPEVCSEYFGAFSSMLLEILKFNNIEIELFYRINVNCVHPLKVISSSAMHIDHYYPHHNMLVYLTNSGGKTIVGKEKYDPNIDDVIIFDGSIEHCLETPLSDRRISLVATFLKK